MEKKRGRKQRRERLKRNRKRSKRGNKKLKNRLKDMSSKDKKESYRNQIQGKGAFINRSKTRRDSHGLQNSDGTSKYTVKNDVLY